VVAGTLRVNLMAFTLLVAAGKTARYAVITAATLGWM
jgi:membrane protein YqaA with SNARE-associated domain